MCFSEREVNNNYNINDQWSLSQVLLPDKFDYTIPSFEPATPRAMYPADVTDAKEIYDSLDVSLN